MTGIAGGGYAVLVEAGSRQAQVLDFFVAVPGLGQPRATPVLEELAVPFGEELVHYYVGAATCAVRACPRDWTSCGAVPGRCPGSGSWSPRSGSPGPGSPCPAHAKCLAMLAPVMTMREGGQIYSPGGRLLEAGDRLDQPGLVAALEVAEGASTFYEGTLAESLLRLMDERDGLVTQEDLAAYQVEWAEPAEVAYACPSPDAPWALAAHRHASGPSQAERCAAGGPGLVLARLLAAPLYSGRTYEHTTNLCVVDAAGSAWGSRPALGSAPATSSRATTST